MKILITTALCLAASVATAQSTPTSPIARGSRLIGGSASISRSTYESGGSENTVTSINVSPMLLVFVRDRIAIGGELGLGRASTDAGSSTSWSLGPAVRWFFGDLNARTLPFVGGALLIGAVNSESSGTEVTTSQQGVELVGGATRMLARNLGITGEVVVARTSNETEVGTATSESTRTNLGLRFGISAFLF
jgi:hypothetical protein